MITSVWKRNDQDGDDPKKVMRDGYLVDIIDYSEQIPGFTISDYMHGPFVLINHPDSHKLKLKENSKALNSKDDPNHRSRKGKVSFDKLEKAVNRKNLKLDCQTTNRIESLDGSQLNLDDLIETTENDTFETSLKDVLAVSSGNYTIGSAGDYATLVIFIGDIAATLTGDLTGTVISDISESTWIGCLKNLAGYDLRITSDTPHYGDYLTGHSITKNNTTSQPIYFTNTGTTGVICIDNLKLLANATTVGALLQCEGNNTYIDLHDLYFDCKGFGTEGFAFTSLNTCNVYNSMFLNSSSRAFATPSSGVMNVYNTLLLGGSSAGFYLRENSGITLRSSISFDNTGDDYDRFTGVTIENCADEDSTLPVGSGNKRGLTPASEIDTNSSNSTYGHPLSELVNVATGGNTNHLSANAMNNIAWALDPSFGPVQAGAAPAAGTIIPILMNYMRRRNM